MKMKVITAVSFILLVLVVVFTLVANNSLKDLEDKRMKSLDGYEATKLWVIDDIRSYLMVNGEETYKTSKQSVHFAKELKDELYANSYNASMFQGASNVNFVDAQYSLEKEDNTFIIYLLTNVSVQGKTKEINLMVFINNNHIYDILAY